MAIILAEAEHASVDFGRVAGLGVVHAGARVANELVSRAERGRAVIARERAVLAATRVHLERLLALKVLGAHAAQRGVRVLRLAQLEQVTGALLGLLLLLAVSVHVGLERDAAHLLLADLALHARQVLVHHANVMTQNVARLVLAMANVALKLKTANHEKELKREALPITFFSEL